MNLGNSFNIENKYYFELMNQDIQDFGSLGTEYAWTSLNSTY